MARRRIAGWIFASLLIISVLAFFGYRNATLTTGEEVCTTGTKEKTEQKVKTAMPMWESLSRHLITIQR
jgi:hypothetical protein